VIGNGGVPDGAVAITGNLTVVASSTAGWAFAGPSVPATNSCNSLNTSMINVYAGDIRADGITVQLGTGGGLDVIWCGGVDGSTTHIVLDVTGYYVNGTSGLHFIPIDPTRVADTRVSLPIAGPVNRYAPFSIPIVGYGHIPAAAQAISGNLTAVSQSNTGYLTVAPSLSGSTAPSTSTVNFPPFDIRCNGFSVLLADGSVMAGYFAVGFGTSHVVMDVTGYFAP
jgi:hypothetical protein